MLMRLMTAVAVAVLVGTPVSSNAELVQANLINHGDGLLTRDMATGLDWLDVNLTVNSSYNDMISGAATFASLGGLSPVSDLGFRHATAAEFTTLLINALVPEFNTGFTAQNFLPVVSLMDLLGSTGGGALTMNSWTGWFLIFNRVNT